MSDTVTVACKLPHGLRLRIQAERETTVPVMGGGMQSVKQWVPTGDEVVLKGVAHEFGKSPNAPIAEGGFALTTGVNAEFFAKWMEQNKETEIVRQGLVFASGDAASVSDQAKDHAEVRSGLEPLDPENLPVKGVETADEQSTDTVPGKAAARRRTARG